MIKQRPGQWHRGNNNNNSNVLAEKDANALPSKPPIPPTAQAKSKLKAFQFIAGGPQESRVEAPEKQVEGNESGQEEGSAVKVANMGGVSTAKGASSAPQRPSEPTTSSESGTSKTPQLPHANTFPCTPGARLPLEDLIGNFDEDARRPEPQEQSPEEQIGWIPNSSSTLLTPHRKRKRARSSSPSCPTTSSQRQEASAFFGGSGTQSEKKTPEADPTADLWLRYGAGKDIGDTLKLPDFSHLMAQASPRPLETPVKSAGLRRWASTGNDWPSSKSKRRRTDARTSISVWQDGRQTESGEKSTVATMVEKIQETLATQRLAQSESKPAAKVEAPASSDPLPEVGAESSDNPPIASPLQAKQTHAPIAEPMQAKQQEPVVRPAQTKVSRPIRPPVPSYTANNVSSDGPAPNAIGQQQFSDVVQPPPLHLQSKAPLPAYRRPAMTRAPSGSGRLYPTKQPSQTAPAPALPAVTEDLDEFGDAFDLSAEDLDELVSQVPLNQRPLHAIPAHPNPPPQRTIVIDEEAAAPPAEMAIDVDEDEFGDDDLDEDTLVEAEFNATQAHRASHSSSNNVCVRTR